MQILLSNYPGFNLWMKEKASPFFVSCLKRAIV